MNGLYTFYSYVNLRRMGFGQEEAMRVSQEWKANFATVFRQSEAATEFEERPPSMTQVPTSLDRDCMLLTAHFGAYTTQLIAISKHFQRPIAVVIGNHPQEFVDLLRSTCAKAGVDATAIRSGMRMLREIRRAQDDGRILSGLFDVPWHRGDGHGRVRETYPFGQGSVIGSDAMFDLCSRLGLTTHLCLHVRRDPGTAIRFIAQASQADCFSALREEVMLDPSRWERLCEVHKYYTGGMLVDDAVAFDLAERRFAGSGQTMKIYEFTDGLRTRWDESIRAGNHPAFVLSEVHKASGLPHALFAQV